MMINPIKVAILCGGKATRLLPLTSTMPKSLIEVAGEPFIFHQLRLLYDQGFHDVVLCVGNFGGMIRDAVGDGSQFGKCGMHIEYSWDGNSPLGTGGAVLNALPKLGNPFMVMYGDSYLDIPYQPIVDVFMDSGRWALRTEYNDIDYGIGVFKREAFEGFHRPFDLTHVYRFATGMKQLASYDVGERFYEIGSPEGLEEVRNKLSVATNASA